MPRALDEITVDNPCRERWETMRGSDTVRHCERCDKDVYDLSSMARADAERLIAESEGSLCGRFLRRGDGTVVSSDEPARRPARAPAKWLVGLGGAVLSLHVLGRDAGADLSVENKKKKSEGDKKRKAEPAPFPVGELAEHIPSAPPAPAHTETLGAISREAIRPPLEGIRACYLAQLQRLTPARSGRVSLKFTVRNGVVESAEIVESTLEDPVVERCMLAVARGWKFPFDGEPITVTYPFVFMPAH